MQLPAENEGGNCWFAIRVSYSRELALKAILDAENIENFMPMGNVPYWEYRGSIVLQSIQRFLRGMLPREHR